MGSWQEERESEKGGKWGKKPEWQRGRKNGTGVSMERRRDEEMPKDEVVTLV